MMKKRNTCSCILLAVLMHAPMDAAADGSFLQQEEKMIEYASTGELKKYYSALANGIVQHYKSPRAWVYLDQLNRLAGVPGNKQLLAILQRARKKIFNDNSLQHKNLMLLQLDLEIEKTVSRLQNVTVQHASQINPVSRWVMAGPYRRYGAGDLWYPFVPGMGDARDGFAEEGTRVNAGKTRGFVRLDELTSENDGIMYAISSFPALGQVKIRVYSNAEYILNVNGEAVLENAVETVKRDRRVVLLDVNEGVTLMLKLRAAPGRWFRVLVTDGSDAMIPVQFTKKKYAQPMQYMESLDYPFPRLAGDIKKGRQHSFARMGLYFHNLGSRESIKYYARGWKKSGRDGYLAWLYLDALLSAGIPGQGDAELKIAGDILHELGGGKHIPARYQYARYLAMTGSTGKAINEGIKILSLAPGYLPLYEPVFTWSLKKGRVDLVGRLLDKMEEMFPDHRDGRLLKAEYLEQRDPRQSERICRQILENEYSDRAREILVAILFSQQRYNEMIRCADIPGKRWKYMDRLFEAYMWLGKFSDCRSFLMKEMVKRANMRALYLLGKMEMMRGEDPALYWERLLREKPEWYWFRDQYSVYNGMMAANDDAGVPGYNCEDWPVLKKKGATGVLFREIEFNLPVPGYCDITWSEKIMTGMNTAPGGTMHMSVPFTGNTRIRKTYACVNGTSYPVRATVREEDGNSVVLLEGVKPRSLVWYSMDIRDSLRDGLNDSFVTMQGLSPDRGDAGHNTQVHVTCPADMNPAVITRDAASTSETVNGRERKYSAEFNGKDGGFSFTTVESWQDFAMLYNALLRKSTVGFEMGEWQVRERGATMETVNAVYREVQQEIDLVRGTIFDVDRSVDVLYRKEGSAAAKTVLAKNMLSGLHIASYVAFPMKKQHEWLYGDSPNYGKIMKPLLYVPLSDNKAVWLDFSDNRTGIGSVADQFAPVPCLVLVGDAIEWVTIEEN